MNLCLSCIGRVNLVSTSAHERLAFSADAAASMETARKILTILAVAFIAPRV